MCVTRAFSSRAEQTAVIKETLRMAVAVPMGLPRVVPRSGAVISGVRIPGRVRVSLCTSVVAFMS
jgi:cytochrome P450